MWMMASLFLQSLLMTNVLNTVCFLGTYAVGTLWVHADPCGLGWMVKIYVM